MIIELLTGILVVVTGFYCWLTFKILKSNKKAVKEMRVQNESLIRPYITASTFVTKGAQYYLKIKNTGNSAAQNLLIKLDKDFFISGLENEKKNIRNAFVFNNIIESFPPGSELFYLLGHGSVLLKNDFDEKITPQEFTVASKYEFYENIYSEKTNINLKQYEGTVIFSDSLADNLRDISIQLEEIKNKLYN